MIDIFLMKVALLSNGKTLSHIMVTSLGKCLETFVSGVMIPYLFSLRISLRICSSSKTFSGCCVARFSFSPEIGRAHV